MITKQVVVLDIESYPNYFLLAIKNIESGKVNTFELRGEFETFSKQTIAILDSQIKRCRSVGFNSLNYDIPMFRFALREASCLSLFEFGDKIIRNQWKFWRSNKEYGFKNTLDYDHVDLTEPAPGVFIGLKKYGARMHSHTIQDLPYPPGSTLTAEQQDNVLTYCENDLDLTIDLYNAIKSDLDLREQIGKDYMIDVMSKSGAQVAEAIFEDSLPEWKKADKLPDNYRAQYSAPACIRFDSDNLRDLLELLEDHQYEIGNDGKPKLPPRLKPIVIGETSYKPGLGGLHSKEKNRAVIAQADEYLIDSDVTSYYPSIICTQGLYPLHLSDKFKGVYKEILVSRLAAKKRVGEIWSMDPSKRDQDELTTQTTKMDTNKLSLNASFGKFGSPYSKLYSPELMLATTLTGQLSLLMLIERLEMEGFKVVSANTDGIQTIVPRDRFNEYDWIIFNWEADTGYDMEYTYYKAVYSQSVNSYLAVKLDNSTKGKGVFSRTSLMKDPAAAIIPQAVTAYLTQGTPLDVTIKSCTDIRQFIIARMCSGGGAWRTGMIGKTLRWIWTTDGESILSAKNGNKVATSDDAMPLMTLPETIPWNINYSKYIEKANKLLTEITNES